MLQFVDWVKWGSDDEEERQPEYSDDNDDDDELRPTQAYYYELNLRRINRKPRPDTCVYGFHDPNDPVENWDDDMEKEQKVKTIFYKKTCIKC